MDLGQLRISVEDKFIILQLNVDTNLLPSGNTLDKFAYILSSFSPTHQVICDFRKVKYITNDLISFIEEFEFYNSQVLIDETHLSFFKEHVNPRIPLLPVDKYETKFEEHEIDLTIFADENSIDANFKEYNEVLEQLICKYKGLPSEEEYSLFNERDGLDINLKPYYKNFEEYLSFCKVSKDGIHLGTDIIIAKRYLEDYINRIGHNSLLSQYCLFMNRDGSLKINTFQSNTINTIEVKNQLIHGKPYIHSKFIQKYHERSLAEFQFLLNNKNVKESQIQKFLENNPIFFESLGYKSVRPQIILEKDDGTFLRPDFMLEPLGDEWWDILDIKLPYKKLVITSKRDRYRFSESICDLQAQLREYSAYFENEKYAKRIEDKYGIKCYKPKLIGIIGNEFNGDDQRQVRRLMTSYSDLKVIPFNKLYNICNERILI